MSKEKTMQLRKQVAPFEKSDMSASIKQIVNTIPPFFILWYLAYLSLDVSIFLTIALAVIASGFIVRIFIISMTVHTVLSLRARRPMPS
ncbi:hypothetical protein JQK62_18690 [Leptospira santarosai]|nr:hypothetical protein [Leptospira santarosai]